MKAPNALYPFFAVSGSRRQRGVPYFLLLAICLFSLSGCRSKDPEYAPVPVFRYEEALMRIDTTQLSSQLKTLAPNYPLYLEGADLEDTINLLRIRNFIQDPVVQSLYRKIETTYGQDQVLEKKIGRIFARTREYFPDFKDPKVYTYISYFDFMNRILYLDSVVSIAIDLYTDHNEKMMEEVGIPRYLSRRMNSDFLESDLCRVILARLIGPRPGTSLLDYIVTDGKILFFMQQILPNTPEKTLLGYTEEEYLWCKAHEGEVWQYIVQQNLLFETNPTQFRYFVNEGPFNPLIPGAPARLNQFIGLRMIQSFNRKNRNEGKDLLSCSAQEVLRISMYKPR